MFSLPVKLAPKLRSWVVSISWAFVVGSSVWWTLQGDINIIATDQQIEMTD